jgi:branched-chain amino acid transport system permease protein
LSFLLALVIGLFSLRVRAIFFAMITLALWLRYNGPDTSLAF